MTYAEIRDLEAGWRPLAADEVARASVLLVRASAFLDSVVERHHINATSKAAALKIVCCDLVQRKMEQPAGIPVSSVTHTAGSFTETTSYSGSRRKSWELYPEDLELLGVKSSGASWIKLAIHTPGLEAEEIDW